MFRFLKRNWIGVLVSLAVALNFFVLIRLSIRLDEAQTLWMTSKSLSNLLVLNAKDVHLPLYYLLMHFLVRFVGPSLVAIRVASFLFFLTSLPFVFSTAKKATNETIAYLSVLLLSTSPFVLWYSAEGRMYALLLLAASIHHWAFLRFLEKRTWKRAGGLWLATLLGIYSHYFFWLLLFGQGLYIVWRWWHYLVLPTKSRSPIVMLKMALPGFKEPFSWLGIIASAGLTLIPWIWFVIVQGSASETKPLITPPSTYNLFQLVVQLLFGFQDIRWQSTFVSLWPVAVLVLFLFFTRGKRIDIKHGKYLFFSSFFPVVLLFTASFIRPVFLSRYLILIAPSFFVLVAWVIFGAVKKKHAFLGGVMASIMLIATSVQNLSSNSPVREDYRTVADYLEEKATVRDVIGVSAPFTVYPLEYTYSGQSKMVTIPEWSRYEAQGIPNFGYDKLAVQVDRFAREYDHLYLVLSYDQGYEKNIRDYLDERYAVKERRQVSPGIELSVYSFAEPIAQK